MKTKLLSIDTNAKTIKGQKLGYMTGILYMAPYTLSGVNLCPMAEIAGCVKACLNTAGLGGVYTSIQTARINKAKWYNGPDRNTFMITLAQDIARLIRAAMYAGAIPLVRLNGTTDIRFENIPVTIDAKAAQVIGKLCGFDIHVGEYLCIMDIFPEIQFYDYTKIANRRKLPSNYDLTFSYSGVLAYQPFVEKARAAGMRIAAVFRNRADIPASFIGMRCVDGDDTDIRHLDPKGVIVALYAKGPAKRDQSGFVVDSARRVIPLFAA